MSFNDHVNGDFKTLAGDKLEAFSKGYPEHQFEGRYRLNPGDTYVEAGAFWGRYGLIASHRVGPKGRVILVEPNPYNHEIIEKMIKTYNLNNITLIKAGIWSKDTVKDFVFYGNPAGGRVASGNDHLNHSKYIEPVEVFSLDTLLPELGVNKVDLLSCDIEGAEYELVKGASQLFEYKKILNIALACYHSSEMPGKVIAYLKSLDYQCLEYHEPSKVPMYGGLVYGRAYQ